MRTAVKVIIILFFISASCRSHWINSEQEYYKWLSNKNNHLISSKTITGLQISVKYLPSEYLTYNEIKNKPYNQALKDSLLALYGQSRTFLLTFSPDESKTKDISPDIMYNDISNQKEYNQRFEDLTFNIGTYVQLKTDLNTYIPVLHVFENTYGISPYRSIYLVFGKNGTKQDDLLTSRKIEVVFNDLIFSTGISYFSFEKSNIDQVPHINFWKR